VGLEVILEAGDALGEESDLNLGGTRVARLLLELGDDFGLLKRMESHDRSLETPGQEDIPPKTTAARGSSAGSNGRHYRWVPLTVNHCRRRAAKSAGKCLDQWHPRGVQSDRR
jgi:hypothetical protein